MKKPCDALIRCKHCDYYKITTNGETYTDRNFYQCNLQDLGGDTPCTTQDYQICPLMSMDDVKKTEEGC